jgi:hypothetical protein
MDEAETPRSRYHRKTGLTTSPGLFFCDSCGAPKPDTTPGRACPDGCGSRVTSSRPPATVNAALAILEHNGWTIRTDYTRRSASEPWELNPSTLPQSTHISEER